MRGAVHGITQEETPRTLLYWMHWLETFGVFFWALLGLAVAKPIGRRLRQGRVVVDSHALQLGETAGNSRRRIAREDLVRAEVSGETGVRLVLRDGSAVRLAFAADRSLAERDLFLACLSSANEPAVEISGVRVALAMDHEGPEDVDVATAHHARRT